jgi:hypothetical protein
MDKRRVGSNLLNVPPQRSGTTIASRSVIACALVAAVLALSHAPLAHGLSGRALPTAYAKIRRVGADVFSPVFEVRPRDIEVGPADLYIKWSRWASTSAIGQGRDVQCGMGTCDSTHITIHLAEPHDGTFQKLAFRYGGGLVRLRLRESAGYPAWEGPDTGDPLWHP